MMIRWKFLLIVFWTAVLLMFIGDARNEVVEVQNNGATMCMACIGLE